MEEILNAIKNHNEIAKKHIEPRLFKRLKIFAGIIFVMFLFVLHKIYLDQISISLALIAFITSTAIGFIAGRMFKMSWHTETQKVVSSMDKIGIVILVLYIGVEIGRKWLFGHWLHGATLNTFGLTFLAGLLLGRLLSMTKNIQKTLREQSFLNYKL